MGKPQFSTSFLRAAIFGLAGAAALASPVGAADYRYAMAYGNANVPACDAPAIISQAAERRDWAERWTFGTGIAIVAVDRIVDAGPGQYSQEIFQRRFCRAEVALSTGERQRLYYRIEVPGGFAGTGWHVTSCLTGYDRWHVYGQNCLSLRP